MKIVAVIPARLASTRFPRKILYEFNGLPMIEHVRRRVMMCAEFDEVIVATCDDEIETVIDGFGGRVIRTSASHENGTSRVAEALQGIDCSHAVLIQGDEPLVLPRHLEQFLQKIESHPEVKAWNAVTPIHDQHELDQHSIVKCSIASDGRVIDCFRRSPLISTAQIQVSILHKLLGIIAFRKDFLSDLVKISPSPMEKSESIEQMRIIENSLSIYSVSVVPGYPSVNEPAEAALVQSMLDSDPEQLRLLNQLIQI